VVIVVVIRRWRRLVVIVVMIIIAVIIPMILLLRSLLLDHRGVASIEDQHSRAGQKKSCQGLGSGHLRFSSFAAAFSLR
jgi:hypothetical protein